MEDNDMGLAKFKNGDLKTELSALAGTSLNATNVRISTKPPFLNFANLLLSSRCGQSAVNSIRRDALRFLKSLFFVRWQNLFNFWNKNNLPHYQTVT